LSGIYRRNLTLLVAVLAATVCAALLNRGLSIEIRQPLQLVYLPLESFTIIFALLVFFVGWHSYETERIWPVGLLSYLFLIAGLLNFLHILSFPTMPSLISPNTSNKTAMFSLFSRVLGAAAVLAAAIASARHIGDRNLRLPIVATAIFVLLAYAGIFQLDKLPPLYTTDAIPTALRQRTIELLMGTYLAAAVLLHRRFMQTGQSWLQYAATASALFAVGELNFEFVQIQYDLNMLLARIVRLIAYIHLYRGMFLYNVRLPILRLQESQAQLHESQRQQTINKLAIETAGYFILECDSAGSIRYASDNACARFGFAAEELIGQSVAIISAETPEEWMRHDWQQLYAGQPMRYETRSVTRSGEIFPTAVTVIMIKDDTARDRIYMIAHDITDRVRSENELKLAAVAFDHSAEAILITDGNARILSSNRAFTTITGYSIEDVVGHAPPLFEHGVHVAAMRAALDHSGDWSGEVEWISKEGELCYEWVTVTRVLDRQGAISNYIIIFSDISEKKRAEEHIQYLAFYDPLTSLPNRVLLEDRVNQVIVVAKREGDRAAVIFIDLDHFKTINDSLGHQAGDKILIEVSKRLRRCVREQDTVARQSGDEFVVVLPGLKSSADTMLVTDKILEELSLPYYVGDNELRITASIGVSIYPDDGDSFSRLIMNADAAMYHAKESGRNNSQFFIDEMNRRAADVLALETRLRRAIERNEFELYYQPQVDLQSGTIVGLEALLRWHDPDHGMVPPAEFIPIAESRNLINPIGNWVLREACRQNRVWQDAGLLKLPIAVNISAVQFRRRDLVQEIAEVLRETNLEARYLELEVTETTVMHDAEQLIWTLEQLRALGVHLAIDDFGTGYSSLSYLKRFAIDKIKIDRSFICDIPGDPDDLSIVRAIIGLGKQLNLQVVAEGVETAEQLAALRDSGCDALQGYYFSRPLPAADIEILIKALGQQT